MSFQRWALNAAYTTMTTTKPTMMSSVPLIPRNFEPGGTGPGDGAGSFDSEG